MESIQEEIGEGNIGDEVKRGGTEGERRGKKGKEGERRGKKGKGFSLIFAHF